MNNEGKQWSRAEIEGEEKEIPVPVEQINNHEKKELEQTSFPLLKERSTWSKTIIGISIKSFSPCMSA